MCCNVFKQGSLQSIVCLIMISNSAVSCSCFVHEQYHVIAHFMIVDEHNMLYCIAVINNLQLQLNGICFQNRRHNIVQSIQIFLANKQLSNVNKGSHLFSSQKNSAEFISQVSCPRDVRQIHFHHY